MTAVPSLAAIWDSTHFADGTPTVVEVEVHDAKGKGYEAQLTAPIYNKLLALGNQTPIFGTTSQDSVLAVETVANGINYDVTHSFSDNVSTILGELPQYTVFYIDSHGGVGQIGDCFATNIAGDNADDYIGSVEAGTAVNGVNIKGQTVGGKGITYPPYNFVMFDACIVMGDKFDDPNQPDDAALSSSFGISGDAGTDRAAIGWDWFTNISVQNVEWTQMLWKLLGAGTPLRVAATLTSSEVLNMGPAISVGGFHIGSTSINPVIQGDSKMTLHGVYGGTTWSYSQYLPLPTPISNWFKPL